MIQAKINRAEFTNIATTLTNEEMEQVAVSFPDIFGKGCFDLVADGATVAPTKPAKAPAAPKLRERKPRAPKEPSEQDIADDEVVYASIAANNGLNARSVAPGLDKKRKGAAIKRLEAAGRIHHQGTAGATRYFVSKANGAVAQAEA